MFFLFLTLTEKNTLMKTFLKCFWHNAKLVNSFWQVVIDIRILEKPSEGFDRIVYWITVVFCPFPWPWICSTPLKLKLLIEIRIKKHFLDFNIFYRILWAELLNIDGSTSASGGETNQDKQILALLGLELKTTLVFHFLRLNHISDNVFRSDHWDILFVFEIWQ